MAAGKKQQSNPALVAMVIGFTLFIVAGALAVIFYAKWESGLQDIQELTAQNKELATSKEFQAKGTLIGDKERNETYLGKLLTYFDELYYITTGLPPQEGESAEVKMITVRQQAALALETLAASYPQFAQLDPNSTGFVRLLGQTYVILDSTMKLNESLYAQLEEKEKTLNAVQQESLNKEQQLLAAKDELQTKVTQIEQDYNSLKQLVQSTSDEKVNNLLKQLEAQTDTARDLQKTLVRTEAELNQTEGKMQQALQELQSIKPNPDMEVAAFVADAEIITVDSSNGVVTINIGSNDKVYPGLTFSVYDRNAPMPKDGKGKAEISVFSVSPQLAQARILSSSLRNPVMGGDPVANLVWNSSKVNTFVVAGEFDLNNDGEIEDNSTARLMDFIKLQGGRTVSEVDVSTDYVVVGQAPRILREPTFEEMELYPTMKEKYEASKTRFEQYQSILTQAARLSIPVFNYERFLHFIGYAMQAKDPGAF